MKMTMEERQKRTGKEIQVMLNSSSSIFETSYHQRLVIIGNLTKTLPTRSPTTASNT